MAKRSVDILLSVLVLLLASPILVVAALAVWIESGRPILFRQARIGLGFKTFEILKIRSMHGHNSGPAVTAGGDPRVTRVGRVLRLTKVDEIPQFWNVLRGDMSVVGPRPEVPQHVAAFRARYQNILKVRPGITDLASIHFRNEEEILARNPDPIAYYRQHILPAKLELADRYIREQSLARDLRIIAKTFMSVLRPAAHR